MDKLFSDYLQSVSSKFSHEETSEMGYRADFEILLKGIFESINVKRIDHDARAKQGNKPDFVVLKNDVPILYIEAKDIGISLDKVEKSEQMARYYGYANLVLTDYLEFRFYRNGLRYEDPIKIANYNVKDRTLVPIQENYGHVAKTLLDFTQSHKEPIKSGEHLSKIMGGKAQRIRDNIRQFLGTESDKNTEIVRVYETIKKLLVHDLTLDAFADMYAQTLVYGLFVARYFDETPDNFTRQEARDLIPKSNPLLQHFFDHIVGPDFDKRLEYIVNELCEVFSHADVPELMKEYFKDDLWGKTQKGPDPVIHFYEDFLKEYDADLRKKMGAYYTPLPVVQFIVRSVDYLLEKEFGLAAGFADTSKTADGIHKVQILDPAVGTGTFISDVIGKIYIKILKDGQGGRWPTYVHNELLPRLHGFELMMTPYTIAHLKLGMAFRKTGFNHFNRRLGIYLTNSLEGGSVQDNMLTGFGFTQSIAEESKEAAVIKNELPIMVVIGNPPYSGVSSNETDYANNLVEKYKIEPGGKRKLQERKHWLNDDYVKFIALAEDMVAKNGEGIIGFITNHGYLDNPTFRGMRWHLMNTFDFLYIVDLHGNANKKECAPDGGYDENVFDIQQGVSIILAVKNKEKVEKTLARVYHLDMWGKKEAKFQQLNEASLKDIPWANLEPHEPNFFFIQEHSQKIEKEYRNGFSINQLFIESTTGIVSARDALVISETKEELKNRIDKFCNQDKSDNDIRLEFFAGKKSGKYKAGDTRGWKLEQARRNICMEDHEQFIQKISYRPFDQRYIYYHPKMVDWGREKIMRNFIAGENYGLIAPKQLAPNEDSGGYVTKHIGGHKTFSAFNSNYYFPLYLYKKDGARLPNLKKEIVDEIERIVGKTTPEDIFDYIYAVLYSPSYRKKYKEFLKIDFPRVSYPEDAQTFKALITLGSELRSLHLLESPKVSQFITTYPVAGSDTVEKLVYKAGKVFINAEQYFGNVPEVAWNFYIGGYQPAQKWLKDRKGRTLTNADIEHYQKIIVALVETGRIMQGIDNVTSRT
ncbi:MAG: type ISP restriction/modification enzyme [Patescibacteria group bacterium]|jgi:hypothetical protein